MFPGRCASFAFEDHNPAFLHVVEDFCCDVEAFLQAHPENIAVIHCKAGRGRTGFMISCLLLYLGVVSTADEAIRRFTEKRVKQGTTALNNPSQIRFVHYWEELLRLKFHHNGMLARPIESSPPFHIFLGFSFSNCKRNQQFFCCHKSGVAAVSIPESPTSPKNLRSPLSALSFNSPVAVVSSAKTLKTILHIWGTSPEPPQQKLRPSNNF